MHGCKPKKVNESAAHESQETHETPVKYSKNQRDQIVFKKFEEMYEITRTVGQRNGANQMEIFLGTIDATDWNGATPYVVDAVNEVKSIKSGESPESRTQKMTKFMTAYEMY